MGCGRVCGLWKGVWVVCGRVEGCVWAVECCVWAVGGCVGCGRVCGCVCGRVGGCVWAVRGCVEVWAVGGCVGVWEGVCGLWEGGVCGLL